MSTRTIATAMALSAAILLSGAATASAAEDHCASRIQTVAAKLNENPVAGRNTRSLAERNAAMGAYLHEQGKHAQAHGYLDFAIGKASSPAG